jgi:hypothetical protein
MAKIERPKQRPKRRGVPTAKRPRRGKVPTLKGIVSHTQHLGEDELIVYSPEYLRNGGQNE